jgi:hypothetical protein
VLRERHGVFPFQAVPVRCCLPRSVAEGDSPKKSR